MVTGVPGPCVGNIGPIPRLGFNGLCLQDGPLAIRQADYASVFPAGLSAAASWDVGLIHQRGLDLGSEFRGKGANVALGYASDLIPSDSFSNILADRSLVLLAVPLSAAGTGKASLQILISLGPPLR